MSASPSTWIACRSQLLIMVGVPIIVLQLFHSCFVGCGIGKADLLGSVAEWNHTSKAASRATHGCRGKALTALRHLSATMEIISRHASSRSSYKKVFVNGQLAAAVQQTAATGPCPKPHGTIVNIVGLFYQFQVRQKVSQRSNEKVLIKDFVKKMSVLHHQVTWQLDDLAADKTIFHLVSQPSVSKRIISLHGMGMLARIQPLSFSADGWAMEGLLSPPVPASCHWNNDFQYTYLNNRWLRGKDAITSFINQTYSRLLASDSCGTVRKHSNALNTQHNKHPVFVIKFTAHYSDFDIASEPDKTVAIFRDERKLKDFLMAALRQFFISCNATAMVSALDAFNSAYVPECEVDASHIIPACPPQPALPLRAFQIGFTPVASKSGPDLQDLFQAGFHLPEVEDIQAPVMPTISPPLVAVTVSRLPSFPDVFPEEDQSQPWLNNMHGHSPQGVNMFEHYALEDDEGFSLRQELFPEDEPLEPINPPSKRIKTQPRPSISVPTMHHHRIEQRASSYFMDSEALLSLDKPQLASLRFIAQVDRKYLAAFDDVKKVLIVLDQHAADERIRFEPCIENCTADRCSSTSLSCPSSFAISEEDAFLLTSWMDPITAWGFRYTIDNQRSLNLHAVPSVLDEALTAADLLEFCNHIQRHPTMPSALLKPPAVHRIAASRACRGAVKFNTVLSHTECRDMMDSLCKTNMPFQCAHGRPSVVPVADISRIAGNVSKQGKRDFYTTEAVQRAFKTNSELNAIRMIC